MKIKTYLCHFLRHLFVLLGHLGLGFGLLAGRLGFLVSDCARWLLQSIDKNAQGGCDDKDDNGQNDRETAKTGQQIGHDDEDVGCFAGIGLWELVFVAVNHSGQPDAKWL